MDLLTAVTLFHLLGYILQTVKQWLFSLETEISLLFPCCVEGDY